MAICLNTKSTYSIFQMLAHDTFFVDKSDILEKLSTRINPPNRYICITKPRRFGKTSVLNMLGAYYCRAFDSSDLFDGLKISKSPSFMTHFNKYNVINLCLNEIPLDRSHYEHYISQFNNSIINDVKEAYPALKDKAFEKASDALP